MPTSTPKPIMKAYLAPLYCQTNPFSQEKLALELILFAIDSDGNPTIFFKLSEKKIQLAGKLTDVSKSFFTTTEKYIQNAVQNLQEQPPLMAKLTKGAALLGEKVYEYLQQYAHGLLEFGALKPFSGAVDQLVFDKLFADFTGDSSPLTPIKEKPNAEGLVRRNDRALTILWNGSSGRLGEAGEPRYSD